MNQPVQRVTLQATDALIVIDVQNDFLPGGALAVPGGDAVIPAMNRYIALFRQSGLPVVFTRDWHPHDHCSFRAQGGPWPPHCVAGTPGAAFAADLQLPPGVRIISKADHAETESYSNFQGTDLGAWLREQGCRRLFIGGLATDYCVLETVRDALQEGFTVLLLEDAIRAVDVKPGDGERAIEAMLAAGASAIRLDSLGRGQP